MISVRDQGVIFCISGDKEGETLTIFKFLSQTAIEILSKIISFWSETVCRHLRISSFSTSHLFTLILHCLIYIG